MTTIEDHRTDTRPEAELDQPDRPGLRPVPDEPGIDVRLVDRILNALLGADPTAVLAAFPADPARPSTRGEARQGLIRNLTQFRSHCLAPALTDRDRAGRVAELAGRVLDHLNTLDPSVVADADSDAPNVPAWVVEATGWADRAAEVGATDDALVDRLFAAYERRVDTMGLDGLFGDQLDFYVSHRDGEASA